ncbi:MAG: dienelactone hydrolase family protein [Deltaproteobacteria bacterium]|nr:dienelactone hydrolase family protein [Deltaproteobacteria bacterium]
MTFPILSHPIEHAIFSCRPVGVHGDLHEGTGEVRAVDASNDRFVLEVPWGRGGGPLRDALVVLWHGAGGDIDERSLVATASALAGAGAHVARARFAYRRLGRRAPDRMPSLLEDQRATLEAVRRLCPKPARLILGGRSMGGRACSMLVADGFDADGLIFLAYPLHPAGKPDQLRTAHWPSIRCPMLFVQGDRDALCHLDRLRPALQDLGDRATLELFSGADHGMKRVEGHEISKAVLRFVQAIVDRTTGGRRGEPAPDGTRSDTVPTCES